MPKIKIAKTVEIPVSQLLKAHRLINELLNMKLGKKANNLLEELKDCNTVTD